MTATGNEAVSLSQLKQWSQTLGGGSDIQRQTLTLTDGSPGSFGNWYLYYSGRIRLTVDVVYQDNMILSLSVRTNTYTSGNNLKLSLSRHQDEKTIYIPSVRTDQTRDQYLPFSTGVNDTVIYAPVDVSGPSFVITLDGVMSGSGISTGVTQAKVCLTSIFAF